MQGTQKSQTIFKKKNSVGGSKLLNFKTCYKATVIEIA